MNPLRHLSLFTGFGGFELGLRAARIPFKTIGYVEIDRYCQRIIRARVSDGILDWAPILTDVRAADFRPMAGLVDIITAGFPCQPHSIAGLRRADGDDRDLWQDTLRAIGEVGPRCVLLENVPGITTNGYAGTVVGQLANHGYDCCWGIVSAADAGAPHLRERWWCFATAADTDRAGCQEQRIAEPATAKHKTNQCASWWEGLSGVGRVVHGGPNRVDRLRALGNGIVPAVVAVFLERLGVNL